MEVQPSLSLPIPLEAEFGLARVASDVCSLPRAAEDKTLLRAFGDKRMSDWQNERTALYDVLCGGTDQEFIPTSDRHHVKTEKRIFTTYQKSQLDSRGAFKG